MGETVASIIAKNPLNPVKEGIVKRDSDGAIFWYSQNKVDLKHGFAILFEMDAREIPISDLDCVLYGMVFGSKFIVPLPGLYDINYGFTVIQ